MIKRLEKPQSAAAKPARVSLRVFQLFYSLAAGREAASTSA